jgi:hypothetical protein
LSREAGEPTLAEARQNSQKEVLDEIGAHPVVSEVLKAFHGARITHIRDRK